MNIVLTPIILSILFQLIASALSIRLIFLTKRYLAWILLSAAFFFMALRRFFIFLSVLNGTLHFKNISDSEYTALLISFLLSIGTYLMIPIFKSITQNERDLTIANKQLFRQKEEAEESSNRLLTFINSIPDIVCYKDGEGRWLLANNADLELFNLTKVAYYGKTDFELAEYTHEIFKEAFQNCMQSDEIAWQQNQTSKGIEKITNSNGITKVYDVYKVPVFHPNGERKGLAVIGRDITQIVEIQENLIIAKHKAEESDQLKMAFLQNMSHEIRTPLNAICGFASFLESDNLKPEKRSYFIQTIKASSDRLLEIVSDILTISSLETKQEIVYYEKMAVSDVLSELYQKFKNPAIYKKLAFNMILPKKLDLDFIISDKSIIFRVMSNLISNAIKFTHYGEIAFGADIVQGQMQFFVKDSGIGISSDHHAIIFENFRQAGNNIQSNYGGTGLGLSIAKKYVELLGGSIWLESQVDKGSAFYFTLPNNATN